MKLKARGLSFNVMETGAGEPALLFLHYWGGSARIALELLLPLMALLPLFGRDSTSTT